jgi:hypothetical protein
MGRLDPHLHVYRLTMIKVLPYYLQWRIKVLPYYLQWRNVLFESIYWSDQVE